MSDRPRETEPDEWEDADAERYQRETHGPIYDEGSHDERPQ